MTLSLPGEQLGLALVAPSRRTDPASSHAAGRDMRESGKAASDCALVLKALREHGPGTYREVAARLPQMEAAGVQKRLQDLNRNGLAKPGDIRFCEVTHRGAQVWCAVNGTEGAK